MFALTESMNYYLCPQVIDMRKGLYGLFHFVKTEMGRNPTSGEVFIFVGRNRSTLKILHWESGGFVLYYKRLEKGTFQLPELDRASNSYHLQWHIFLMMMEGICIKQVKRRVRL